MPPQRTRKSGSLAIALNEKQAFLPGETIIGTIQRWLPIVDPEVVLGLKLHGSAKVRITHGAGKNRRTYGSRTNFWSRNPVYQEIYRGPVHIPENTSEPLTWAFTVTIPVRADDGLWRQIENDAQFLNQDDPLAYELPPTFSSCVGETDEFYVEYYLEATLKDNKGESYQATLPVTIRRSYTPTPISDFALKKYSGQMRSFSTYRLDPNYTGTELSFKQKAKEMFGSSDVPTLTLRLEVLWPSVLQIGHPEPAPFHLRAILQRDRTSEVVRDTYPAVIITRFKMKLDEHVTGIAASTFSKKEEYGRQKWTLIDWTGKVPHRLAVSRPPSRQPSPPSPTIRSQREVTETDESSRKDQEAKQEARGRNEKGTVQPPEYKKYEDGQDHEGLPPPDADTLILPWDSAMLPLDLGQALGLRVPQTPKYALHNIQPSFSSVTIKTHHMLRWEMHLYVAGEECTMEGTHMVEVLGPSDDDIYAYSR